MNFLKSFLILFSAVFLLGGTLIGINANDDQGYTLFLVHVPESRLVTAEESLVLEEKAGEDLYWARFRSGGPKVMPAGVSRSGDERSVKLGPAMESIMASSPAERQIKVKLVLPRSYSDQAVLSFMERNRQLLADAESEYGNAVTAVVSIAAINNLVGDHAVLAVERQLPRVQRNRRARILSLVHRVLNDYGYEGSGIGVTVVDGGPVFRHNEFGNRLSIKNGGGADDHATHVAGTIGASGNRNAAMGMAPEVSIFSYDFNGDVWSKMRRSKNNDDAIIANNSWGYVGGWEWEEEYDPPWAWYGDQLFGGYVADSRQADNLVYRDDVIVVFAAGNERDNSGPDVGEEYYDYASDSVKTAQEYNPDGPYTCVGPISSAKNVITVGALRDNRGMTEFSSWGPTQDGRIKPEITANGDNLLSTVTGGDYDSYSGTSMAAPTVSGGLSLVAEAWNDIVGGHLPVDVARALLAACAKDLGPAGPDYRFGFGIMDVYSMITVLERQAGGFVVQGSMSRNGEKQSFVFTVPVGKKTAHIAIAWIDPPAAVNAKSTLVNDIDMVAIAPNKDRIWPFVLNPGKPGAAATTGRNSIDNIELITIENAGGKRYVLDVKAKRLVGGSQKFAIAARYR